MDTLQYSAYRWRKNFQTFDNELFIAYYIKIYKDGKYVVMRHNSKQEPARYFKGEIGRAIQNLIDSVSNMTLDSTYFSSELEIYDGNIFQIRVSGIKVNKTHFYKADAPALLNILATKLDTVIFQSFESIQPFNYSLYQEELKRESINIIGVFPKQEAPKLK